VFVLDFQVGFDDPMPAVVARALKQERVRPLAPDFVGIDVALRAGEGLVEQGVTAGQADPAGGGVAIQELAVR
jgi:hypothetical protein